MAFFVLPFLLSQYFKELLLNLFFTPPKRVRKDKNIISLIPNLFEYILNLFFRVSQRLKNPNPLSQNLAITQTTSAFLSGCKDKNIFPLIPNKY